MFNTIGIQNFGLEFQDSTVTVLPGTARIGNTLINFDGSSAPYERITDFLGVGTEYQNTLLFLTDFNGVADMTRSSSDVTSALHALESPVLPTDSSNPYYSPDFPLTELTIQSSFPDGTNQTYELLSYTKII